MAPSPRTHTTDTLQPAPELAAVLQAAERFVRAIEARSIALMLKLDLTMPQLRVLMTIRRLRRAHGRQLAAVLKVTPGAIVAICDHLEARGYVRRVTDTHDRRITWFELTDHGLAGLKATPTADLARSRIKALIAGLSEAQRQGFITVADAFVEAISVALEVETEPRAEATDPARMRR
jgi:DNA-binding MarR family transcriptional regulator